MLQIFWMWERKKIKTNRIGEKKNWDRDNGKKNLEGLILKKLGKVKKKGEKKTKRKKEKRK